MANNKIVLSDGTTLIDLTGDTVTAETLLAGITAHAADGSQITGTADGGHFATGEEDLDTDTRSIDWPIGQDFTPTGILILRIGTTSSMTTQSVGSIKLIGYLRIGNRYWTLHTSQEEYAFRTYKGTSSSPLVAGHIQYSTSNASYYLSAGRWKWVAWRTDMPVTRAMLTGFGASPDAEDGIEEEYNAALAEIEARIAERAAEEEPDERDLRIAELESRVAELENENAELARSNLSLQTTVQRQSAQLSKAKI